MAITVVALRGGNLGEGRQTSAATATALTSTRRVNGVVITAELNNTDVVVVGDSSVVAALGTRTGHPLQAGESVTIQGPIDLADIYINAVISSEGVTFLYATG